MEIWQTLLLAFGGNSVLLAVLTWITKSLLSNSLAKDLKKFESELNLKVAEHQTKFIGLHEKRAIILSELINY